jgi:hypothetical protein
MTNFDQTSPITSPSRRTNWQRLRGNRYVTMYKWPKCISDLAYSQVIIRDMGEIAYIPGNHVVAADGPFLKDYPILVKYM